EDEEKIRSHLTGADMVFITAGMGGGTGTGGAPVVAQVSRDLGILTIAVVTLPFRFEGRRRLKIAEAGIRELEDFVDTLIVIPNEKLLSAVEPDTTVRDAFMKADEILSNAVQGISDLITEPGEVNVDFADVKTIMTDMGKALLGTGLGFGESRAVDAVDAAISSPLLDNLSIDGARGILINITSGDDLGMIELNSACHRIEQAADEDALIIFGHVIDPEYAGKMKITVIATGFEKPKVRDHMPAPLTARMRNLPETPAESPVSPRSADPVETAGSCESDPDDESAYDPQLEQTNPAFYPSQPAAADSASPETSELTGVDRVLAEDALSESPSSLDPGDHPVDSEPFQADIPEPVDAEPLPESDDSFDAEDLAGDEETRETEIPVPVQDSSASGHLRMASPETAEELAVSAAPSRPVRPSRPELELSAGSPAIQDSYPVVPDYRQRNLGSGTYKKETNLNPSTQRIYYGDINTPAFLRRKAD
nr:cell division protein FtsZ [bacterium]